MRYGHKVIRRLKRRLRRRHTRAWLATLGLVVLIAVLYSSSLPKYIDPTAYRGLLDVIAKGESQGSYNAYFGRPANSSLKLTDMSVAQVLTWQQDYVQAGSASSAAGRYQIIQPTLEGLVRDRAAQPSDVFSPALQDHLAIKLAERRGAREFVAAKISAPQFAANLSREWAALPRVMGANPTSSFYAGDGLNQSRVPVGTILHAVDEFKRLAQ